MVNLAPYVNRGNEKNNSSSRRSNRKLFNLMIVVVSLLIIGVVTFIFIKNPEKIKEIQNEIGMTKDKSLTDKDTGDIKEGIVKNIKNVTIDDVKESSNSTGVNPLDAPALSDADTNKQIREEIGNTNPENHVIGVSDNGIGLPYQEIKQGDYVTWANQMTDDMKVVGEGWDSVTDRAPGENFTYTFYFSGEYKYKVNDKFEGTINVVKQ